MDEERDVEQTSEDEDVEAHRRRDSLDEPGRVTRQQEDEDDEVEAHRRKGSLDEPGHRF